MTPGANATLDLFIAPPPPVGFSLFRTPDPAMAEHLIKPVENWVLGEPTSGLVDGLSGPAGRPNLQFPVFFFYVVFFFGRPKKVSYVTSKERTTTVDLSAHKM